MRVAITVRLYRRRSPFTMHKRQLSFAMPEVHLSEVRMRVFAHIKFQEQNSMQGQQIIAPHPLSTGVHRVQQQYRAPAQWPING